MRKQFLRSCCLAAAACAFLLGGCQTGGQDVPTIRTTEPLIPAMTEQQERTQNQQAPTVHRDLSTLQLRLHSRTPGWWQSFRNDQSYFLVADSVKSFSSQLKERGIDPAQLQIDYCDNDFFRDYVLVIIPRTSSSGSVRYTPRFTVTPENVYITVDAQMPEIGTQDMADWLVVIPVPREHLEGGRTILVDPKGNPQGGPDLAVR